MSKFSYVWYETKDLNNQKRCEYLSKLDIPSYIQTKHLDNKGICFWLDQAIRLRSERKQGGRIHPTTLDFEHRLWKVLQRVCMGSFNFNAHRRHIEYSINQMTKNWKGK